MLELVLLEEVKDLLLEDSVDQVEWEVQVIREDPSDKDKEHLVKDLDLQVVDLEVLEDLKVPLFQS